MRQAFATHPSASRPSQVAAKPRAVRSIGGGGVALITLLTLLSARPVQALDLVTAYDLTAGIPAAESCGCADGFRLLADFNPYTDDFSDWFNDRAVGKWVDGIDDFLNGERALGMPLEATLADYLDLGGGDLLCDPNFPIGTCSCQQVSSVNPPGDGQSVPEPASAMLLIGAFAAITTCRRHRRQEHG